MARKLSYWMLALALCLCMFITCAPAAQADVWGWYDVDDQVGYLGDTLYLYFDAYSGNEQEITYEWYYRNDDDETYTKSSQNTPTYSVTIDGSFEQQEVYCVVSSELDGSYQAETRRIYAYLFPLDYNGDACGYIFPAPGESWYLSATNGETASTENLFDHFWGDDLTFTWYYANAGSDTFKKASITGSRYSVEMNADRAGRRIYCVVSDAYGNSYTTGIWELELLASDLWMEYDFYEDDIETTYTAPGETFSTPYLYVYGDGIKYTWYYANKGSNTFKKASVTGSTYSVTMDTTRAGRRIYCVITDMYGQSITTGTWVLELDIPELVITKEPEDVEVISGAFARTAPELNATGLKYAWYYANKGSDTFKKASITGRTYSVQMNSTRDGRRVYCVITDKYGQSVTTETVTLSMIPKLKVTEQPKNTAVFAGETATVSVSASDDNVTYQWYYANPGSSTFKKASIKTSEYSVEMSSARDGRRVYCVITDQYGQKATSKTVTLNMMTPIEITKQPVSTNAIKGKKVTLTVEATGDDLTYRWYYKNPGSDTFKASSVKKATYTATMSTTAAGREVYCLITDKFGQTVQTDTVVIDMPWPIRITQQPVSASTYDGMTVSVFAQAEQDDNATLTYQWYYANKGSSTFKKASVTGQIYTMTMTSKTNGRRVYCLITDQYGQKLKSDVVTLTMAKDDSIPEGLKYSTSYDYSTSPSTQYVRITGYTGSNPHLAIPATINGMEVREIDYYAFSGNKTLISVSLPSGIRTIDSCAFYNCSNLAAVNIPSTVTLINGSAFYGCTSLATLNIPSSVTSMGGSVYSANTYVACDKDSALALVLSKNRNAFVDPEFPKVKLLAYEEGSSRTFKLAGLAGSDTVITTADYPTKTTAVAQYAFSGSKLTKITLRSSIKTIEYEAFYNCDGLTGITLPSKLTTIGESAFYDCDGLTSISIPNTVTSVGPYAFYHCSNLATAKLSSGMVEIPDYMFYYAALTDITIPSSVKSIGRYAFCDCNLTDVTLPSSVTTIEYGAFEYNSGLKITVPSSVTTIESYVFYTGYSSTSQYAITVRVYNKSYPHQYCVDNNLKFEIIR